MKIHGNLCAILFLLFASATVYAEIYTVGIVPQVKISVVKDRWAPILKEISLRSGFELRLLGAPNIPEFEKRLRKGKYDLAYMNPYHLIMSNKSQGYEPILRDHDRTLAGILVVKKSSPITDVKQLNGQIVAFPAPNALGASLLVRSELSRLMDVHIVPKYVKTHDGVYRNVSFNGTVAGGGVLRTFKAQSWEIKNDLRVLYETKKVSPHPIAIHPRVSDANKRKIIAAFLALADTKRGKALLSKVPMKDLGKAELSDYESVKKMNLNEFVVH